MEFESLKEIDERSAELLKEVRKFVDPFMSEHGFILLRGIPTQRYDDVYVRLIRHKIDRKYIFSDYPHLYISRTKNGAIQCTTQSSGSSHGFRSTDLEEIKREITKDFKYYQRDWQ